MLGLKERTVSVFPSESGGKSDHSNQRYNNLGKIKNRLRKVEEVDNSFSVCTEDRLYDKECRRNGFAKRI